jgi:hypothetical protein
MEFFIRKNATLHLLKIQDVKFIQKLLKDMVQIKLEDLNVHILIRKILQKFIKNIQQELLIKLLITLENV